LKECFSEFQLQAFAHEPQKGQSNFSSHAGARKSGARWWPLTICVPERWSYNWQTEVQMKYRIAMHKSDEGYSVSVPGLPGCWSQGTTEQEAVENIRDAIREYLSVVEEQLRGEDIREIEVAG
jgi:predicted RNase H-like HicB family nuclease